MTSLAIQTEASHAATEAIKAFAVAAEKHRLLTYREAELEAARPVAKLEAIRRIMEQPNEETGKAHSYSSAEKAVETDTQYADFLRTVRDNVLAKQTAWAEQEAARLKASLYIRLTGEDV